MILERAVTAAEEERMFQHHVLISVSKRKVGIYSAVLTVVVLRLC